MDLLAPITRRLIAPAWALWERSPYLRQYRRLLRTQFDPPQEIRRRQWERIESLLEHAWQTTRFWRLRLQEAGLEPGRIRSFDDFRGVPLLTKADLRAYKDDLMSREGLLPAIVAAATGTLFDRHALPPRCTENELQSALETARNALASTPLHNPERAPEVLLGSVMENLRGRVAGKEVAGRVSELFQGANS